MKVSIAFVCALHLLHVLFALLSLLRRDDMDEVPPLGFTVQYLYKVSVEQYVQYLISQQHTCVKL